MTFVGQIGDKELAAASMASTLANVTGLSVLVGLSSGFQTLGSQAFGAGAYRLVGLQLQRCLAVSFVASVAVSLFWTRSGSFLRGVGQDPTLARMAGQYMAVLIPGLWGFGLNFGLQKFLQVQGQTKPPAVAAAVTAVIHIPLNYLFIYRLGWGYLGAAAATSATQILTAFVLLGIIACFGLHKQCWHGWSLSAVCEVAEMKTYLRIAVPGLVMIFEWWASEIAILMSGFLPHPELTVSTMALYQTTNSFCFMFAIGFQIAAATRVGHELGAGEPKRARFSAFVSPVLAAVESSILAVTLLSLRRIIPTIFTGTQTPEARTLAAAVADTYPFLAAYVIGDAVSTAFGGVITGAGKQQRGAILVRPPSLSLLSSMGVCSTVVTPAMVQCLISPHLISLSVPGAGHRTTGHRGLLLHRLARMLRFGAPPRDGRDWDSHRDDSRHTAAVRGERAHHASHELRQRIDDGCGASIQEMECGEPRRRPGRP